MTEMMKAIRTPRMVMLWAPRRPICLPKKPAAAAPTRGASGTASSMFWESVADILPSALQRVELIDIDGGAVAEQHDQDGQADRRLGCRHGQDEEHEDLACHIAQIVREGHEVQVHRQEHQLDRHQQHDQVLAVQEDADHRQREQHRAQGEEMAQGQGGHHAAPLVLSTAAAGGVGSSIVGAILMIFRRCSLVTLTCSDGFWPRESLRWRRVRAMAAMTHVLCVD
eukprot:Opistho-2@34535